MPTSNYPNGFVNGITIRELPLILTQNGDGNVFWVDSNKGSDGNKGSFKQPFATIDYAIGRCTADQGDTIVVAAGHVESVIAAGGVTCDVAGLNIIFLGEGSNCGTISFGTDVAASIVISAANVTLINPRFLSAIDALTGPISITGANCRIFNASWYDAAGLAVTDCVIGAATATGLIIDGWTYYASTTGTQKQSQIQLNGVDNAILRNIDIAGDFATGNIENITDELLNVRLENIKLKNENATPKPGMVLDADCTGFAKNVDIRIVSGTTYVSSNAKLNWDIQCLGYAGDGTGGDPIGTAGSGTIEAKVDAIQADIGDPSARTNFQSIEAMIGIPDAANSSLDDMVRTGFSSTATTANADGSVLERLEFLQQQIVPDLGGLIFSGACDAGMAGSTTTIVSAGLAGYGDDFFNTKYYMQIIKNSNSVGNAPEREVQQITDYVSTTGTFTTNAFTGNVEEADSIMIIHESLIMLGRDDASNAMATTNVVADADGSIVERQEYIQSQVNKLDSVTLAVSPVAGSLARFVASGGTALGTPLADSKSLVDALGTDGTTVTDSAVTVLGAVGANNANNAFDSSAVVANADGSVLERQESIQASAGLDVDSATTDNLHGKLGTDTEMADRSVFDLLGGDGFAVYPASAAPGNDVSLAEVASAIYDDTNTISGISLPADPVANSLAAFIASGGTALGTELADSKSIVDAIGSDGTTLSYGSGSPLGAIGSVHIVKKTLVSSAIVQAGVDVTGVSSGGDLMIEEIYMNTDGTGLANGTNFQLETDNASGVTVFFAETVANLGANKTETIATGSVTSIYGTVLESGKKIIAKSTVADCTGAGTITLIIKLRRVAAGATVAAA